MDFGVYCFVFNPHNMPNRAYQKTLNLQHDELPAILNTETGQITVVKPSRPNNIPDDQQIWEPKALFRKDYTNSWQYLQRVLTHAEFGAAHALGMMAKANTNSLQPLDDNTTLTELVEVMGVSINKVRPILQKLFEQGVYGKFEIVDARKGYTKYWVFNPYLAFSGRLIKSDIGNLFKGTHCARALYDPTYRM